MRILDYKFVVSVCNFCIVVRKVFDYCYYDLSLEVRLDIYCSDDLNLVFKLDISCYKDLILVGLAVYWPGDLIF